MDLDQRIRERIAKLRREREQLVAAANQQVAALNGAIAVLEDLAKSEEPPEAQESNE